MQFDNAWEGNWLSFCAGREVVNAMIADANKGTMLVHNGDISYAQGFTYGWDVYWYAPTPASGASLFHIFRSLQMASAF